MLGHRLATDGDKPEPERVFAWNNEGEQGRWRPARLGRQPFNPSPGSPNNPALHFAARLSEGTGTPVFLVGCPINGSSIVSWQDEQAENMARLLAQVRFALNSERMRRLQIENADAFLWLQGESDDPLATMVTAPRVTTLDEYRRAFRSMKETLHRQPWWNGAKFIAGTPVTDGWLSARSDFYSLSEGIDAVVSSEGLGHVGDRAHFNGEALQVLGERMYKAYAALGSAP